MELVPLLQFLYNKVPTDPLRIHKSQIRVYHSKTADEVTDFTTAAQLYTR